MIIPFATAPRLALRSSQSSVQWVRRALSVGLKGTRTLERVARSARKESIHLVNYYAASHADPHETRVGQFRHTFSGANPFPSGRRVSLTPQWRYHIAWRDKKGRMIQPALILIHGERQTAIDEGQCWYSTTKNYTISEILITATKTAGKYLGRNWPINETTR